MAGKGASAGGPGKEPAIEPAHPFWQRVSVTIDRVIGWFDGLVTVTEVAVALVLALAAVWLFVEMLVVDVGSFRFGAVAATELVLDRVLLIFIVVELFRIAVAYTKHEAVLHTVFEAAVVAVARKFVLYDFKAFGIAGAGSYALLLAVAVAGYVAVDRLAKARKG